MTPDVHRLVGQYEEAAHETRAFHRTTLKRVNIKVEPHKTIQPKIGEAAHVMHLYPATVTTVKNKK